MVLTSKLSNMFYGWWIVIACFAIYFFTGGAVILGFTAFFEPIANEFGWSYTQISLGASIRGIEVGLLAPLVGLLVDRLGPRRMVLSGALLMGIGLILISRIDSLGMFYGAFALIAIGYSGTSPTVMMAAAANWFRKKVGRATGIMASGFALGGLLVPVVVRLIDVFEWRTTILSLGLAMWVIILPLSLVLRHKPEQYGYLPDGERNNPSVSYQGQNFLETSSVEMGARQVLKSRIFWHIVISLMCQFFAISTVIVHVIPYLSSVGIVRSTSSLVAMAVPLTSIIGRLSSGWFGDRFEKKGWRPRALP